MHQLTSPEVLFVSHKYPPGTGGMEKQSFELIEGSSKYIRVHKIVYIQNESVFTFFRLLNRRILTVLKDNPNIQIIHFNDGLAAAFSLRHKGYENYKKIVTVHGLDVVFPLNYFQKKIVPNFGKFDKIIAVSQATAQALISRGVPSHKVIKVNNGVDGDIVPSSLPTIAQLQQKYPVLYTHPNYLITLGRAVKRKGLSWLLEKVVPNIPSEMHLLMLGPFHSKRTIGEILVKLLPKKWSAIYMLFAGYPSDQMKIRQLLQIESIAANATHLGKVPVMDLLGLLSHAKAFLMPNVAINGDMEGFGLVCLEASVAGTLVIASSLEGLNDAVHHDKNGILLTSMNAQEWIEQINRIVTDPVHYRVLAHNYQQYTRENFSWDKMVQAYIAVFNEVVAKAN